MRLAAMNRSVWMFCPDAFVIMKKSAIQPIRVLFQLSLDISEQILIYKS